MGLALMCKGHDTLHIGYGGFSIFRKQIAQAYSEKHGSLYSDMLMNLRKPLPDNFNEMWNDGCDDNLDILLWHSDCDGRLTPQESRMILNSLKKLTINFEDEYYETFYKNFLSLLEHSKKRRVIIFFC